VRLIDADALNKELQKRVGSPTDEKLYEANLCIIDAPTINAIPVEWVRNMMVEREAEESRAAWLVLREWKKEQEAI
jgi:hypothetical protein